MNKKLIEAAKLFIRVSVLSGGIPTSTIGVGLVRQEQNDWVYAGVHKIIGETIPDSLVFSWIAEELDRLDPSICHGISANAYGHSLT